MNEEEEKLAHDYLRNLGYENPTPDAVAQLAGPFNLALRIMMERDFDPNGDSWRHKGWRGLVHDMRDKMDRIWYRSWLNRRYDGDSPLDLINFAGFYWRLNNQGEPWGDWEEPG